MLPKKAFVQNACQETVLEGVSEQRLAERKLVQMFLNKRKRDVKNKPNGQGDMQRYKAMPGEILIRENMSKKKGRFKLQHGRHHSMQSVSSSNVWTVPAEQQHQRESRIFISPTLVIMTLITL